MSQSQPRHAAPNPNRNIKAVRTVRFWAAPLVITLALMSALCALYLGGIVNPTTNLRHFPIAVVNEDAGPAGAELTSRLVNGLDKNKFDVRVVTRDAAKHQLDTAHVYGSVLIPPSFSSKLRDFGDERGDARSCGAARRSRSRPTRGPARWAPASPARP